MATEVVKNKDGSYTVTTSSGSSRVSGNTVTTISGSGAYGSTTPKPSSPTPTPTAPKPSSGGGGNTNQTVSDPVKYDPYTGKVLPTGGSFVDQNTGKTIYQGGSLSGQLSGLISTDTLTNTPENMKAEIPTMPQIDYSKYIPTTINTETDPMKAYEANSQANFQTYLQGLIDNELPSAEDSYARAQKESGILKAQQQVNDLTGQLNQIVAQGQASQLQVVGQGRGIPEAIIGGQQAQIARETAIRALPVSAQLQAAQGNLEMAQQNMETLFNIYHEDAKAKYEYKKDIIETFYNFASEQEKTKLAYAEKMEERTYQEKQSLIKSAEDYAKIALSNNQGVLASKIGALDPTSETYREDLSKLTAQIDDPSIELELQLKREQIATEKEQRANIAASRKQTEKETTLLGTPEGTTNKPPTQAQYTAAGFASRVVQAKDIIDENTNKLSTINTASYITQRKLPNYLQSPLIQKELQAERNFVNAVLRRESGAAISPSEFESAEKQYFPMPGDSAEVLAQKKANRDLTSQNLINESGSAYQVNSSNPFQQSLGQSSGQIPGTNIIQSMSNGIITFNIPTN
jgi:hypothetical protein